MLFHIEAGSFNGVGGTDAFIRRISYEFERMGHKVYLLSYGSKYNFSKYLSEKIVNYGFCDFGETMDFLSSNNIKHCLCIYLKKRDRVSLLIKKNLKFLKTYYHLVQFNYITSDVKRFLTFVSNRFFFNGLCFCVSKRIRKSFPKEFSRAIEINLPVDDSFYSSISKKKKSNKKRIAYLGRLDYSKGADIAYKLFKEINTSPDFKNIETFMYSYPWENDNFSLRLEEELKKDEYIKYIRANIHNQNVEEIDNDLKILIDSVDLFILPYRSLENTVDCPLVPLEINARKKFILTSNLECIKDLKLENIYYNDFFRNEFIISLNLIKKILFNINQSNSILEVGNKYRTSIISEKIIYSFNNFNKNCL